MEDITIASIESLQLNVIDTVGNNHKIKLYEFLNIKEAILEVTNDKRMLGSPCKIELTIPCDGYSLIIDENIKSTTNSDMLRYQEVKI